MAADVDLLLAEASFRASDENPTGLHLTGTDCGEVAARKGAHRLLLTHIPPWYDWQTAMAEARDQYDGPIDLAVTGSVHEL